MAKWLWACLCCVLQTFAEDDASCALQAQSSMRRFEPSAEMVELEEQKGHPFCRAKNKGTVQITFKEFTHGQRIKPKTKKGMTITAKQLPKGCTGGLMIHDTRRADFKSRDPDLKKCNKCALLIYSADGDTTTLDDCEVQPGPTIVFEFDQVHDVVQVVLFDQEELSTIFSYDDKGKLIGRPDKGPQGADQDGKPAIVGVFGRATKKLEVALGGSGAVHSIYVCKERGSVFGDPHIYTLDGGKYDLFESGTYSVFRYAGHRAMFRKETGGGSRTVAKTGKVDWQLYARYGGSHWTMQGLLLVDRSLGKMRQKMELTAKDCKWRSQQGGDAKWSIVKGSGKSLSLLESGEYVTGFMYHTEKHISLRLATSSDTTEDILTLNVVCKPDGINARVSMEEAGDQRFLEGQIQPGNGDGKQKFEVKKSWAALGGTEGAANFLDRLPEQYSLVTACSEAEKKKAGKVCKKHLDAEVDADVLEDCISDVCRGGEEFAIAAAEMLSQD